MLKPLSSINLKLAAFGAILVLLLSIILSAGAYFFCQRLIRTQLDQQLRSIVVSRQKIVLGYISEQEERIALISSRTRLRELIDQFKEGRLDPDTFQFEARRILLDAQRSIPGLLVIGVADQDGRVIAATDPSWLKRAVSVAADSRAPTLGLPAWRDGHCESLLTAPIPTQGSPSLLFVILSLDPLAEVIADRTGLGQTGEVLLASLSDSHLLFLFPPRFTFNSETAAALPLGAQSGFGRAIDYRGAEVLVAIQSLGYRQWIIAAKMDVAEAYAPLSRLRNFMSLLALGNLVLGIGAMYALSRLFTRPIRELAQAAQSMAHGSPQLRVPVRSSDELGQLATAFNEMADQVAIAYQSLEKRVLERTRELAESNRELERFASLASHDLQEPLRMVASYTKLLQDRYGQQLDAQGQTYMNFAIEGATRMRALINDLLTYSRVGTRHRPFDPCELERVFADAIKNLEIAIRERQALVTHDRLPTVAGDFSQLTELFQNLLANAIKFSPEVPAIHVTAIREANDWLVSVRDNGIGIETQFFETIFEIFHRLHTASEYPGTGIGLALCRRIIERHGGRIWVSSQPGSGSTFYFTLPALD